MRSVRRYLRLQRTLAPMEQLAALTQMARSGSDDRGRRLRRSESADIAAHLAAPTPWKPTEWLVNLYGRLERGEPLPASRAQNPRFDRLFILLCLVSGDHPGAAPLFEPLSASPETRGRTRGLVLRWLARNGRYAEAYRWIETRLLDELAQLSQEEALGLIRDVARVQSDELWDGEGGNWRSDAHVAATWPQLAQRIDDCQIRMFGRDHSIPLSR